MKMSLYNLSEFRDIDTTGGSLRENLIPLPVKEPSNVLMQLLGLLVDSGKRLLLYS